MAKKASTREKSANQSDSPAEAVGAAKPRARRRKPGTEPLATAPDSSEGNAIVAAQPYADASVTQSWEPTEDEIRVRAYHRYLERGAVDGLDFEDWLEAERELKQRK